MEEEEEEVRCCKRRENLTESCNFWAQTFPWNPPTQNKIDAGGGGEAAGVTGTTRKQYKNPYNIRIIQIIQIIQIICTPLTVGTSESHAPLPPNVLCSIYIRILIPPPSRYDFGARLEGLGFWSGFGPGTKYIGILLVSSLKIGMHGLYTPLRVYSIFVHGRGRMTADARIPTNTMPGRSMYVGDFPTR